MDTQNAQKKAQKQQSTPLQSPQSAPQAQQSSGQADSKQPAAKVKLTKKQNLIQTLKFVIFSATAGIIQTITFTLMFELGHLPYWPSYLTALVLSVLYNFTINRKFTFKSANNVPIAMLKVAAYYAVFTPASTLWGKALTDAGWNEYLVLFLTMLINLSTEFLFNRFVVYRNSINTNSYAHKQKWVSPWHIKHYIKTAQITPNPSRRDMLDEQSKTAVNGATVFAGDSITELFDINEHFNGFRVYNRGISGDTSAQLLARLSNQVISLKPSKVVLLIGTNDIAKGVPTDTIRDNVAEIIYQLSAQVKDIKIYLLSVLPINGKIITNRGNDIIQELNAKLRPLAVGSTKYIDIYDSFADATGILNPLYTYDGLHLGYQGYIHLKTLLLPYIAE